MNENLVLGPAHDFNRDQDLAGISTNYPEFDGVSDPYLEILRYVDSAGI